MKVRISWIVILLTFIAFPFTAIASGTGKSGNLGRSCEYFVQRLIEDDYSALLTLEVPDVLMWSACQEASEFDSENPAYKFGLAIQRQLSASNYKYYDKAISLLKEAANSGYEPAQFQLLRYMWQELDLEDAFLRRRRLLRSAPLRDDPLPLLDKLKSSKSETVRDFVLGYIVTHFVQKRFALAKEIAFNPARQERPKNILYLGIMYLAGWDVERDKEKGISLIRRAATLGDLEAQNYYARHFWPMQRDGEMPDARTLDAYRFVTIAANRGHRSALMSVDQIIFNQSPDMPAQIGTDREKSYAFRNELMKTISCTLTDETRVKLLYHKVLPECSP